MVIQDVKRINKLTSNLSVECSLDLWCLECLGEWDEVLDGVLVLLGLNILVLSEEDLDDVFEWLSTFSDWLRTFPKKVTEIKWFFNINTNETKDHNFSKMFVSALKKGDFVRALILLLFFLMCLKEETKSNMGQKEDYKRLIPEFFKQKKFRKIFIVNKCDKSIFLF